jgi:crossover junction endodeoxyribonuclease RusA
VEQGVKITLPWLDKRLTPNAKRRKHWTTYSKAINDSRQMGWALTCEAMGEAKVTKGSLAYLDRIALEVTFYPPDNRRRDLDGMIGAFKHMLDGISDALGVDDSRFELVFRRGDAVKNGKVEVQL